MLDLRKQPNIYILGLILVLFVGLLAAVAVTQYAKSEPNPTVKRTNLFRPQAKAQIKQVTSLLDGLQYPETEANRHALGVMIENHPDARPQFGLNQASVVYEAQAEGGITRFLAIFGPQLPDKVGPVRSARTYYLDWCLEYDCFYAHVGGNIDVLDEIPGVGTKNLDQFAIGERAYYRQAHGGVATEHTMYATPSKLYEIAQANKWPMIGEFPKISFKKETTEAERGSAQTISMEISSKQFNTSWQYDPETNSYARSMAGAPHIDAGTNKQITAKVLITQEVPTQSILTRINEQGLKMQTVGSGKAEIFQDGQRITGTWKKASQKTQTIFYDANGNELKYNPGQRWITILTPGSKVTVTNPTAALTTPTPKKN